LQTNGNTIPTVELKYLCSTVQENGSSDREIEKRISETRRIVSILNSVVWNRNILHPTMLLISLLKSYHLDVVGGPSTPHDPESDAGGSLSSWQGHPSR
jgi:hypothetical protein